MRLLENEEPKQNDNRDWNTNHPKQKTAKHHHLHQCELNRRSKERSAVVFVPVRLSRQLSCRFEDFGSVIAYLDLIPDPGDATVAVDQ
jgi:hypothetical protein